MHTAFIRQYQAYAEALEGTGYNLEQFIQAQAKTLAVDVQFAAEKAAAVLLFDSKRELLAEMYHANPDADFKTATVAEKLGLPVTRGYKLRIALALKQLRLTDMRSPIGE